MRRTAAPLCVMVWLLFTGISPARAEPARWPRSGPVARFGSAVGFSEIGDRSVSTLGGQIALGYRLGPFVLDAEYEKLAMLHYLEDLGTNIGLGDLSRIGVSGRLFVLHLGRGGPEASSLFQIYVEGGAGRQSGRWSNGDEFDRDDVSAGTGFVLDHRFRPRHRGLPFQSIGWQLGWRMTAARADGDSVFLAQSCKGKKCRPPPMPRADVDLGLLVTCAMTAAW